MSVPYRTFALALLATAAFSGEAMAQSEEIIVTARKREEALKDVPIAVSVIDSDTIERRQLYSVKDVAALAPGLNINSDAVGRAFISIRGIGTTLIDTVQPGVGIFIDGIYLPNTSYLNTPLVDVARVEVLRGPQGTLFGQNTLGGAINVITKAPPNQFEGRVTGTYAGTDNFGSAAASIGGPLVDGGTLRFRIGAAYHHQDGFEKNALTGNDTNPLDQRTYNATLRWDPTPKMAFTLKGYYDRVHGGSTAYVDVAGPTDVQYTAKLNQDSLGTYTYKGLNLRGEFDVDPIATRLTATVAYDRRDSATAGDGDFGPVDFLRSSGVAALKTVTGELRADTTYNDRISSLIGVFADRMTSYTSGITRIVPLGIAAPSVGTTATNVAAVFGTAFWKFTDQAELAAGIRYDHQRIVSASTIRARYSANQIEPRVTLSYKWTPEVMTYASVARGYRGGGTNGPGAPNPIYRGDSVWTYELGTKFEALGRRLSLNAAVFYNDYDHFIGQNALAPSTTGVGFVAVNLNSGHVQSYGAEFEGRYKITENWSAGGGLTLLHARIDDGTEFFTTTRTTLASDRIIFTPDWNYNLDTSYVMPVATGSLVFDANVVGKGDRKGSTLSPTVSPTLASYTLVGASVAYRQGPYEIALFATNLFDEKYFESYIDSSLLVRAGLPASTITNLGIPGDRRRVGVRASFNF
ncbi:MAG: TonB-dependent receptor [Rhodospirillales bacterium]|nr:TonB-dependent receptor [Rhodospirillales bacterium]